jgi:hypothetical protein
MVKPNSRKTTAEDEASARPEETTQEPIPVHSPSLRDDAIAKLAYQFWLERGSPEGSPEADWFRAELLLDSGAQFGARPSSSRQRGRSMTLGAGTGK